MNNNVLVAALDGLDKELIDEFALKNIKQEKYGFIDNKSDMKKLKTSELFASFITGVNWEKHGLVGIGKYPDTLGGSLVEIIDRPYLQKNIPGFYRLKNIAKGIFDIDQKTRYSKEHLEEEPIFEKIEYSRAMFVPSYNPGILWEAADDFEANRLGYSVERNAKYWDKRAYEPRKKEFRSDLENDIVSPLKLLMVHFHRPDIYHHPYGDVGSNNLEFDRDKLRKMYLEIDEFCKEIRNKASKAEYEYIIFMSDHGLPNQSGHNENAFYSCNRELFGEDETPHITDFHDKILELTENEEMIGG
jgi:hypothetical protein